MKAWYFVLIPLALAGCGGDEFQDLRDYVATTGANERGKVEPPLEFKPYEPFAYDNSDGLPDPFKPRKSDLKMGKTGFNRPDFDRPKEELEEFPLDSMKMVGFLLQGGIPHAVVRPADGKLRRIKIGNHLGQNFGKVIAIRESEIVIKEMVQDSADEWSERESSLQLVE